MTWAEVVVRATWHKVNLIICSGYCSRSKLSTSFLKVPYVFEVMRYLIWMADFLFVSNYYAKLLYSISSRASYIIAHVSTCIGFCVPDTRCGISMRRLVCKHAQTSHIRRCACQRSLLWNLSDAEFDYAYAALVRIPELSARGICLAWHFYTGPVFAMMWNGYTGWDAFE